MKKWLSLLLICLLLCLSACKQEEAGQEILSPQDRPVSEEQTLSKEEKVPSKEENHQHPENDGDHDYSWDDIFLANGVLYYEKNGGILQLNTETGEKNTLSAKGALLGASKEWVYYQVENALMAARDGDSPVKLIEGSKFYCLESGEDLFVSTDKGAYLLKGAEIKKVLEKESYLCLSLKENSLYWIRLAPTRALCKTDLADGVTQELGALPYGAGKPRLQWVGERLYYFQSNGLYCYTQSLGLQLIKGYEKDRLCYFADNYAYVYDESPGDPLLEVFDLSVGQILRTDEIAPKSIGCFGNVGIAYYTGERENMVKETPDKEVGSFSLKEFNDIHMVYPLENGYCVQTADPAGCSLCGDSSFCLIIEKNGTITTTEF